ncbi:hypothetical protein GF357_04285 [Candidatus Dojkabacteria bacterium]|nr:hypothetical protein [Candidatus Dojkabacteria bacterium]
MSNNPNIHSQPGMEPGEVHDTMSQLAGMLASLDPDETGRAETPWGWARISQPDKTIIALEKKNITPGKKIITIGGPNNPPHYREATVILEGGDITTFWAEQYPPELIAYLHPKGLTPISMVFFESILGINSCIFHSGSGYKTPGFPSAVYAHYWGPDTAPQMRLVHTPKCQSLYPGRLVIFPDAISPGDILRQALMPISDTSPHPSPIFPFVERRSP